MFLLKQIKIEDQEDEEQEDETEDRSEIFKSHLFITQYIKYWVKASFYLFYPK